MPDTPATRSALQTLYADNTVGAITPAMLRQLVVSVLFWKGAWNSSTTYALYDIVTTEKASFICITSNTNINPDNDSGSNWARLGNTVTQTLDTVTTAGNTTTNSITVGGLTSNGTAEIEGDLTVAGPVYGNVYVFSDGSYLEVEGGCLVWIDAFGNVNQLACQQQPAGDGGDGGQGDGGDGGGGGASIEAVCLQWVGSQTYTAGTNQALWIFSGGVGNLSITGNVSGYQLISTSGEDATWDVLNLSDSPPTVAYDSGCNVYVVYLTYQVQPDETFQYQSVQGCTGLSTNIAGASGPVLGSIGC